MLKVGPVRVSRAELSARLRAAVGDVRIRAYPLISGEDGPDVVFGMVACLVLLSLALVVDMGFGVILLYAFPIALGAWLFGRWVGILMTAFAVLSSVLVGISQHDPLAKTAVAVPALAVIAVICIAATEWARNSERLLRAVDQRDLRQRQMLEALTRVGQELVTSKRWDVIADEMAQTLEKALEVDVAWMFRTITNSDAAALTILGHGVTPPPSEVTDFVGTVGWVVTSGAPLQADSAADLAARYPEITSGPLEAGLEAQLVLPVIVKGSVSGVVLLGCRTAHPWSAVELGIASSVTSQLGLAMENASAHRATIEALVRLEEVIQMKSDFLKTVSHELRTPITVLAGYIDMMGDGSLGDVPARWAAPLNTVSTKAAELNRLVVMMLDASRAEGPAMTLNLENCDLHDLLDSAVQAQEREARQAGRELRLEPARNSLGVRVDRDKTLVVVRNLIENAIKYSPEGSKIDIGAQSGDDYVTVWVADRGPGVADDEKIRVFEQFYRVERPESRGIGGTGLGLYIVKHLLEMQGGRIEIRDRPGGGSVFAFTLPRQHVQPQVLEPRATSAR